MKNLLKSLLTLVFFTIITSACQPQADVSTMLKNEETRNQIYEAIISDHEYSKQLMQAMIKDGHTQMMMSNNEDMIGMMKENPEMMQGMMSNMMEMADSDSTMCANMMTMMKDKPNMMGKMMEMMHKEGLMDKETMMKNKENMEKENPSHHH